MWGVVIFLARLIIPPMGADPVVFRWQISVSAMLGVTVLSTAVHIAWACGFLTFFHATGFANAQDVNANFLHVNQSVSSVSRQIVIVQSSIMDQRIWDDRERQCKPSTSDTGDFREMLAKRLAYEESAYRNLTGQDYRLPDCTEF